MLTLLILGAIATAVMSKKKQQKAMQPKTKAGELIDGSLIADVKDITSRHPVANVSSGLVNTVKEVAENLNLPASKIELALGLPSTKNVAKIIGEQLKGIAIDSGGFSLPDAKLIGDNAETIYKEEIALGRTPVHAARNASAELSRVAGVDLTPSVLSYTVSNIRQKARTVNSFDDDQLIGEVIGIAKGIGELFGGPPEDKSTTGFDRHLMSRMPMIYPPMSVMLSAVKGAKWEQDNIDAVQNSYDESTGTGSKGDWRFAVVSTSPITVKWFKGAGEQFIKTTNTNFNAPPLNQGINPGYAPKTSGESQQQQYQLPQQTTGVNWNLILIGISALIGVTGIVLAVKNK